MKDYIDSLIRTWVPLIVGPGLLWLSTRLGVDLSDLEGPAVTLVTGLAAGVYYALVRLAERRWPSAGWLLGKAGSPRYGDLDGDERP